MLSFITKVLVSFFVLKEKMLSRFEEWVEDYTIDEILILKMRF